MLFYKGSQRTPLRHPPKRPVPHYFIDRSIIEIFANKRQCITQCIYPTREDSTGINFFSKERYNSSP